MLISRFLAQPGTKLSRENESAGSLRFSSAWRIVAGELWAQEIPFLRLYSSHHEKFKPALLPPLCWRGYKFPCSKPPLKRRFLHTQGGGALKRGATFYIKLGARRERKKKKKFFWGRSRSLGRRKSPLKSKVSFNFPHFLYKSRKEGREATGLFPWRREFVWRVSEHDGKEKIVSHSRGISETFFCVIRRPQYEKKSCIKMCKDKE